MHSSTGLKLPLQRIADALKEVNSKRDESQKVLMCIDGVHGFGVEDIEVKETGCDFFMAGCHKWLFGPRGTGIIWGNERAWSAVSPIIPTFMDDDVRNAWMRDERAPERTTGRRMTPGGFKAFEHQWAMAEAFKFHLDIGKDRIAARTHELNRQLKEGLAGMSHVKLYTPRDENLSSGIVCFDIDGMSPSEVVGRLRQRKIVATTTPYADSHARVSPSIREFATGNRHCAARNPGACLSTQVRRLVSQRYEADARNRMITVTEAGLTLGEKWSKKDRGYDNTWTDE